MRKRFNTEPWLRLAFLAGLAIVVLTLSVPDMAQQPAPTAGAKSLKKKKDTKSANSLIDGPAFTLDHILKLVDGIKNHFLLEPNVLAAIKKRGLSFKVDQGSLKRLEEEGASPALVSVIAEWLPPKPIAPVQKQAPPTGTLYLSCEPAECKVSIDGGSIQETKGGVLQQSNLPIKQYRLELSRDGYISKSLTYPVTGPKPEMTRVVLDPSSATKAQWGRELLDAAIKAVEGKDGATALRNMTASGTAGYLFGAESYSEWNLKATFRPSKSEYELSKAAMHFSVLCTGEQCEVPKKDQKKAAKAGDAIDTSVRLFNKYNLISVLDGLRKANQNVVSDVPRSNGSAEQHFTVQNGVDSYRVTLNAALEPSEIVYTTNMASFQMTYGEYTTVLTGARYPTRTVIVQPAGNHKVEVNFASFSPAAPSK